MEKNSQLQIWIAVAALAIFSDLALAQDRCASLNDYANRLRADISQKSRSGISTQSENRALDVTVKAYNGSCTGSAAGASGGNGGASGSTTQRSLSTINQALGALSALAAEQAAARQNQLRAEQERARFEEEARQEQARTIAREQAKARGRMPTANPFGASASSAGGSANPFEQSSNNPRQNEQSSERRQPGLGSEVENRKRYCANTTNPGQCEARLEYAVRPDPQYENWKQERRVNLSREIDAAEADLDRALADNRRGQIRNPGMLDREGVVNSGAPDAMAHKSLFPGPEAFRNPPKPASVIPIDPILATKGGTCECGVYIEAPYLCPSWEPVVAIHRECGKLESSGLDASLCWDKLRGKQKECRDFNFKWQKACDKKLVAACPSYGDIANDRNR